MPRAAGLIALSVAIAGSVACTHRSLARSTLRASTTVMEIQYIAILTNLAMMSQDSEALPNHIRLADGVVQVNDRAGFGGAGGFTTFGGSSFGIEQLGPSVRRQVSEQWGTDAITDPERLYDLQSLYRKALGLDPMPIPNGLAFIRADKRAARKAASAEGDSGGDDARRVPLEVLLTDVPQPGWYQVGSKRQVPKDTRYVGRSGDRYAWVTLDGVPRLTRFTLAVLTVIKLEPGEGGLGGGGLAVTAN